MRGVFGVASVCAAAVVMTAGGAGADPGDVSNGDMNLAAQQQVRQLSVGADIAPDVWTFQPPGQGLTCYWGFVPYPGHDASGKAYSMWPDTLHLVGLGGSVERLDSGAVIETNCYLHRARA